MSEPGAVADDRGHVVVLGESGSTEIAIVGGKGASLGRFVQADFPVPPGFVVTTFAYASFYLMQTGVGSSPNHFNPGSAATTIGM
jgi:hypothetical protein